MRLLVPVDGSDISTRALQHAIALCQAFGSAGQMVVVAVDDSLFPGAERKMGSEAARAHHAENYARMLGPAKQLLGAGEVDATFAEVEDDVAEGILKAAAKHDVDMIVMGSRGAGAIAGALLGSVSMKVLTDTRVPVTIVH